MKFPGTKVHILPSDTSDHKPICIIPDGLEQPHTIKPFRFEEMWLSDPGCANIVEAMWSPRSTADPSEEVMQKIDKSDNDLSRWKRVHFGNVTKELEKKCKLLRKAEEQTMLTGVNHRVRALQQEVKDLMDKENRLWFQRAKVLWASNGDKNSKFFHGRATHRKRKNSILRIQNSYGQWRKNPSEVDRCLVDYFKELFTSVHIQNSDAATNSINSIISEDMNAQLTAEFMEWEVQAALKQMAPLKAPGSDGISSVI
ncbi:hypothetical protein SO802_008407 [Lithocarpus litseifolius]|uniref:Reverse transcriptase n=1 Tax=Lithocarpus litseifolius TaxID=425828 RepID=A0AAW2DCD6_9ROSI